MRSNLIFLFLGFFINTNCLAKTNVGNIINWKGIPNCIELRNSDVVVVIDPNVGGRVVEYSLQGRNLLYESLPDSSILTEKELGFIYPPGGRFDIGPEKTIPKRPMLFKGKWTIGKVDPLRATIISQNDTATGVQLTRIFTLEENGTHLQCTQIVKNISNTTKKYYFWARTFAKGNGISVTPLSSESRYPMKFLIYGPDNVMNFMPNLDSTIIVADSLLIINGPTTYPKFAIDCNNGWLAYYSINDLLFVKKFPVYQNRAYGDMAANSVSVWYFKTAVCEIEPMGPLETILPGSEAMFTEEWWLYDVKFPQNRVVDQFDLNGILEKSKSVTF